MEGWCYLAEPRITTIYTTVAEDEKISRCGEVDKIYIKVRSM
jgi:hypothetical protein